MRSPGGSHGPTKPVLIATTLITTASRMAEKGVPYHAVTVPSLVKAWRGPSLPMIAQVMDWAATNNQDALFHAGSGYFSQVMCGGTPSGCPSILLPTATSKGALEVRCSPLDQRCKASLVDRWEPFREIQLFITTDLEGRLEEVTVASKQAMGPVRDIAVWLEVLRRSVLGGLVLTSAMWVGLWLGTSKRHPPTA